ncbi:MAG: hypothetical protein KC933_34920 [Myxococcales bacterium]|nr:hypothetical protein [Myxococcales bacterium]MCB9645138.1 hypothetical protein [Deltaproteobacteria bacterium]
MTAARRKITKAEKQSASPARGRRGIKAKPVMPQTASSKTEEQMAARLATLEPGSKRFVVLDAAIRFKRSWVELAQYLTRVREEGLFKEWGYRSFEAYAQHELHLKKETAQKLVRSYDFLNAHERPQLEAVVRGAQNAEPLPSFQALDILAEARQNPYLDEDSYREIRDQVFRDDPPPAQVRKLVKERAPEPPPEEEDPQRRLRKCLSLAERLYGMLLEEDVPDNIAQSVEQAVGGLRRMLDE